MAVPIGDSRQARQVIMNPKPKANVGSQTARNRYVRTRDDHSRELAEDYVELIDDLINESGEARAVDIAHRLGVSNVTVTKAISRLKREGLVTTQPYRAIFLTEAGQQLADESRRRHQMVLEFLLALGVPKKHAELDAEGIEHHLSPATLECMRKFVRRRKGDKIKPSSNKKKRNQS